MLRTERLQIESLLLMYSEIHEKLERVVTERELVYPKRAPFVPKPSRLYSVRVFWMLHARNESLLGSISDLTAHRSHGGAREGGLGQMQHLIQ